MMIEQRKYKKKGEQQDALSNKMPPSDTHHLLKTLAEEKLPRSMALLITKAIFAKKPPEGEKKLMKSATKKIAGKPREYGVLQIKQTLNNLFVAISKKFYSTLEPIKQKVNATYQKVKNVLQRLKNKVKNTAQKIKNSIQRKFKAYLEYRATTKKYPTVLPFHIARRNIRQYYRLGLLKSFGYYTVTKKKKRLFTFLYSHVKKNMMRKKHLRYALSRNTRYVAFRRYRKYLKRLRRKPGVRPAIWKRLMKMFRYRKYSVFDFLIWRRSVRPPRQSAYFFIGLDFRRKRRIARRKWRRALWYAPQQHAPSKLSRNIITYTQTMAKNLYDLEQMLVKCPLPMSGMQIIRNPSMNLLNVKSRL